MSYKLTGATEDRRITYPSIAYPNYTPVPLPKTAWVDPNNLINIKYAPEPIKQEITPDKAARANGGKLRWSLLPLEVFAPVVEVLMFGAKKYAAWNFTNGKGLSWTEVGESMQRHINAWLSGEDKDPESGLSHLGHIGCNLMFLLYYRMYASKGYQDQDDRFKRND